MAERTVPGILAERVVLATAGVAVLVLGLGGCKPAGRAPALTLPATVQARGWPSPAPGGSRLVRPLRVLVPAVKVDAPVLAVNSGDKGRLQAPPLGEANLAGWDRQSPVPGQPGASVLVGHLDTKTGPAVFARLRQVKPGDTLAVLRSDDRVVVFRATGTEQIGKAAFPVHKVFAGSAAPAIRLVTCGGRYDHARHSYEDNLIVYGEHAGTFRVADLR
ncbi:class F sortase [Nonomuraea sp. NPDC050310]|uniref:class F sortase n=1 Tax=Nonomuraea sp. NPDC050310 TaxID=3154935 RepID=UPI0033F9DD1D